jgi:putative flippase GtrA
MNPYVSSCAGENEPGIRRIFRQAMSACTQLPLFLISGGLATISHWTVMLLLIKGGASPLISTAIGASVGAFLNYEMQFYWTFGAKCTHGRSAPFYACTALLSWGLNASCFYVLITIVQLNIYTGQVLTTAIVTIVNFILYKRIVFHAPNSR